MTTRSSRINAFGFQPGQRLAGKYVVDAFLGAGYEGEVYRVIEASTKVTRAAKLFFPHRNLNNQAVRRYARKLEKLDDCPAIIRYHHTETITIHNQRVTCLISEFVEGALLSNFLDAQPGHRMHWYEALCLTHEIAAAVEQIHAAGQYHGDLHHGNIMVRRRGIRFDVHLVDFYDQEVSKRQGQLDDIVDIAHILYHAVGGKRHYNTQPAAVKELCKGLRKDLILKRFRSAARMRRYLETFA